MSLFKPCQGKNACRDDGVNCLSCGRSFQEITQLRDLLDQLTTLAIDFHYENIDEYSAYLSRKVKKMINYRLEKY